MWQEAVRTRAATDPTALSKTRLERRVAPRCFPYSIFSVDGYPEDGLQWRFHWGKRP